MRGDKESHYLEGYDGIILLTQTAVPVTLKLELRRNLHAVLRDTVVSWEPIGSRCPIHDCTVVNPSGVSTRMSSEGTRCDIPAVAGRQMP